MIILFESFHKQSPLQTLLVPLHSILFIRLCLLYLDRVISTPLVWKKRAPVRVPTMKKCHEATSGDTATDRNPLSEIVHLVCGTLEDRCLSRGGGSAKLGTMQALPIAWLTLTLSSM